MELTLNNLLSFFEFYCDDLEKDKPNVNSNIRNDFFNTIDGDDAIEMLILLDRTFNVDFCAFEFTTYFLEEIEISKNILCFGIIKPRKIKDELTIQMLYDYMILHKR